MERERHAKRLGSLIHFWAADPFECRKVRQPRSVTDEFSRSGGSNVTWHRHLRSPTTVRSQWTRSSSSARPRGCSRCAPAMDVRSSSSPGRRSRARRSTPRASTPAAPVPALYTGSVSNHWGPVLRRSDDLGTSWTEDERASLAFPDGSDASLARIWQLTPGPADQPDVDVCRRRAGGAVPQRRRRRDSFSLRARVCGTTRTVRNGSPAAADCACTRSSSTPTTPTACSSRSRRPACT